MKKLLFTIAICSLFVNMADSQTTSMFNRIDTCLAGQFGGVTGWKPCNMPTIGKAYTFSMVGITQTAALRFVFTWRDTAAGRASGNYQGGGVVPFISGQNITVTVPNVGTTNDTVWIKGTTNDIFRMWKF